MFDGVVAPLTGIVGSGVPIQCGCAAVPERGWGDGGEDPVLLEVGDVRGYRRGLAAAPDCRMIVIRGPLHRLLPRSVESASAGRGILLLVSALPVVGPIRLSAVECIYMKPS